MNKKEPTSVSFDSHIKPIKDHLAAIYGLKSVVSTGVFLFSKLTDRQQKEAILEMKKIPKENLVIIDKFISDIKASKHAESKKSKK